jgi:hypothetical protein
VPIEPLAVPIVRLEADAAADEVALCVALEVGALEAAEVGLELLELLPHAASASAAANAAGTSGLLNESMVTLLS